MNRIAFALVLSVVCCATSPSFAFEDACGDKGQATVPTETDPNPGVDMDSRAFFDMAKGTYTVVKTNVLKSLLREAGEATTGQVEVEEGQAVLAFSFCPPSGGCDPNYVFLEMAKTKITQKASNDGTTTFTIVSEDGGKPTRYTWDVKDGLISLKNYQYVLEGKTVTLEHVIKKL